MATLHAGPSRTQGRWAGAQGWPASAQPGSSPGRPSGWDEATPGEWPGGQELIARGGSNAGEARMYALSGRSPVGLSPGFAPPAWSASSSNEVLNPKPATFRISGSRSRTPWGPGQCPGFSPKSSGSGYFILRTMSENHEKIAKRVDFEFPPLIHSWAGFAEGVYQSVEGDPDTGRALRRCTQRWDTHGVMARIPDFGDCRGVCARD